MNKIYLANLNTEIILNFANNSFYLNDLLYKFTLNINTITIYWSDINIEKYHTYDSYIYHSDNEPNYIKLIYLIHSEWFDQAIINYKSNTLKRIKHNNETGKFNINDNFIEIFWDYWGKEIFIKKDDYSYYKEDVLINKISNNSILSNNNYKYKHKIIIFIHICCIENWEDIFTEQIYSIKKSGLYNVTYKIMLCILGDIKHINNPIFTDKKFNIIYIDTRLYLYELLTINSIKSYCERMNDEKDLYILYIHTKGVRKAGDDNIIKSWRNMMEYFLINCYKECLDGLENLMFDTIGNNIINEKCTTDKYANVNLEHTYHYSGNFWWSKKSYIDKLNYIDLNLSLTAELTRYKAENWILSLYPNPNINIGVLYQDNTNIHPYHRYIFDYYKNMYIHIKSYIVK